MVKKIPVERQHSCTCTRKSYYSHSRAWQQGGGIVGRFLFPRIWRKNYVTLRLLNFQISIPRSRSRPQTTTHTIRGLATEILNTQTEVIGHVTSAH